MDSCLFPWKLFLWLLISISMLPPNVCAVEGLRNSEKSYAIVPVRDGDADEMTHDVAMNVHDALRATTDLHLVQMQQPLEIAIPDEEGNASSCLAESGVSLIAQAEKDYYAFRERAATKKLLRATLLLAEGTPDQCSGPALVKAYLLQSMVSLSHGRKIEAKQMLLQALHVHPALELPEDDYSPRLVSLLEELRGQRSQVTFGTLRIRAHPKGVRVFLNGIERGVSPMRLERLPLGSYALSLMADGYHAITQQVEVKAGKVHAVRKRLHKWREEKGEAISLSEQDRLMREGSHLATRLKVSGIVFVDADQFEGKGYRVVAFPVHRQKGIRFAPCILSKLTKAKQHELLAVLTTALAASLEGGRVLAGGEIARQRQGRDPDGSRKRSWIRHPLFWGAVGVVATGAAIGGVLAAMSGGSETGSVRVNFSTMQRR